MHNTIQLRYLLLFILLLPAALAAQKQDSINLQFLDSLKHEIESTNNKQKKLELNSALGISYNAAGKYDSARLYLSRALSLPGGREYEGGRLITNLANSYGFEGHYTEALKYYMEALRVSEQIVATDKGEFAPGTSNRTMGLVNIVRVMANLAEVHYMTGNRKQALYYAECGKDLLAKTSPNTNYMAPQILYIIGSIHLDRNELDKAEAAMQETYEAADATYREVMQSSGDPSGMYMYLAYGKEGMAQVSLAQKDYDGALKYAGEALGYAELHGDPTVTAKILSAFSDIHHARGNYAESGRYAQKAMTLFPDYSKLNPNAAFNAATARLYAGDREEAFRYFQLYADRMKANADKQFRETMAGMEVIYETEKKELRISNLEWQKVLYIFFLIAAILLAVAVWIAYRQKIRSGQKEKELAVTNAILEWEEKERKRFAHSLHDGVNSIITAIKLELARIENTQSIRDQLDVCVETIRNMARGKMSPALERYGLKAALEDYCRLFPDVGFYFFGEDRRIDGKIEQTVYFCAYELVHNSVRHSGATAINVQLVQESDRVSLTVQDNGCGYDTDSSGQGGLKSLRDRVAVLSGKMETVSSPETGTETTIELRVES